MTHRDDDIRAAFGDQTTVAIPRDLLARAIADFRTSEALEHQTIAVRAELEAALDAPPVVNDDEHRAVLEWQGKGREEIEFRAFRDSYRAGRDFTASHSAQTPAAPSVPSGDSTELIDQLRAYERELHDAGDSVHSFMLVQAVIRLESAGRTATAVPSADSAWHPASETPPTKPNDYDEYIVAVRRSHAPDKVFVFSANYANGYDGVTFDEEPVPTSGWYNVGLDMSGECSSVFEKTLNDGDELIGWQPLPKWGAPAPAAPLAAQQEPDRQVPEWRAVDADEHSAAKAMREQFEAEHGDMVGVMMAVNDYKHVVEQFNRPYNRDYDDAVTFSDIAAAKETLFERIRAEARWLVAAPHAADSATVPANANDDLMRLLCEYEGALQDEEDAEGIATARQALLDFLRPIRAEIESRVAAPAGAGKVTPQQIQFLMTQNAVAATLWDDSSLRTVVFGEYGFGKFVDALLAASTDDGSASK